jgi:hypothetical protein
LMVHMDGLPCPFKIRQFNHSLPIGAVENNLLFTQSYLSPYQLSMAFTSIYWGAIGSEHSCCMKP